MADGEETESSPGSLVEQEDHQQVPRRRSPRAQKEETDDSPKSPRVSPSLLFNSAPLVKRFASGRSLVVLFLVALCVIFGRDTYQGLRELQPLQQTRQKRQQPAQLLSKQAREPKQKQPLLKRQPPDRQPPPQLRSKNVASIQGRLKRERATQEKCDCRDPLCRQCHRGIVQVHKMGVTLLNTVMTKYFPRYQKAEVMVKHGKLSVGLATFQNPLAARRYYSDYRHVVVTRNFEDSLISGYLYHKAHMECELDWFGKPGFNGWLLNNSEEDWEKRIVENTTPDHRKRYPWPAGNGRDLCTYLSEESEQDGMRVYVEWSKHIFLDPLLDFNRARKQMESGDNPKTRFVCFEDLRRNYIQYIQDFAQWFAPGSTPIQVVPNGGATDRDVRDSGGQHDSDKNPELRARLKAIIHELDNDVFDGAIKAGDAEFGCRA